MCTTLAETVSLQQESIYTEAANTFGYLPLKTRYTFKWYTLQGL